MKKENKVLKKLIESYKKLDFEVSEGLNYIKKGSYLLEFGATFEPYSKKLENIDDVCAYINNEKLELTYDEIEILKNLIINR